METRASNPTTDHPRAVGEVVVASRHLVVAQAVTAGLWRRGVGTSAVDWRTEGWQAHVPGDGVMVLIEELDSRRSVAAVGTVVARVTASGGRVLVLSGCPIGPAWGAVLAAGASGVMTSDCSLDELEDGIRKVAADLPLLDPQRRAALEEEWAAWRHEEELLRHRIETLSPRETSVLAMLAQGHRVADIGRRLGVSEGTVRSHVRSLRRKLGVDSQLAAVAIARRVAGLPERPVPPAPRRPRD